MVQMVGGHAVKHTSNLQGATGLNVSECEYYALTHGAAHCLGLRSYMADLRLEKSLEILSDSSAARAFASRRGLGRQRHVQIRYLWLQERVGLRHVDAHSSQKELRLESVEHSHPMLACAFSCDKLANMD